jgi:hypothetical protein
MKRDFENCVAENLLPSSLHYDPVDEQIAHATRQTREFWPFSIRVAVTSEQLAKVVQLRYEAYNRHVPAFATSLLQLEEADNRDVVLIAESKLDGTALGTMRIACNRHRPLAMESAIHMPEGLQGKCLGEATRLAIRAGSRLVREAMFKAFYEVCLRLKIDVMVITARPPLDRIYAGLTFEDIDQPGLLIPIPYVGHIPHRILRLNVADVEPRWQAMEHPLYRFFFETVHPDLHLDDVDFLTATFFDMPKSDGLHV